MNETDQLFIDKLSKDPVGFAALMDEGQIEHVIVGFVSVLIQKKYDRGGEN